MGCDQSDAFAEDARTTRPSTPRFSSFPGLEAASTPKLPQEQG